VHHIHDSLGISQPTASRHLAYLRRKHLVQTRREGLWVHYSLAPLDDPVLRVLMSAVTHVLCHCESITKDRARLKAKSGFAAPGSTSTFECCAAPGERRQERRKDRRRTPLKRIHTS
jgi:hypothetical protein